MKDRIINIYVDTDCLRLGAIELMARLVNYGVKPYEALQTRNNHYVFVFKKDEALVEALEHCKQDDYYIIYK